MTTVGCMIVLDGEPWLSKAVASLQHSGLYAKEITIVEGAVPAANRTPGENGWCSRDGTDETLRGLEAAGVSVIQAGNQPDKTTMWNLALTRALEIHPDATSVLFLDSDEVLPAGLHVNDLEQYARAIGVVRLDFPMVHFFRDTAHRVVGGPWAQPHRRFWMLPESDRPDISFKDHRPPWMWAKGEPSALAWTALYHYGWVGLKERTIEKCRFYERLRPDHPTFGRHVEWYRDVFLNPRWDIGVHVTEMDSVPSQKLSRVVPWNRGSRL